MRGETIQNNFIVLLIGTVTLLFSLMVKFSQKYPKDPLETPREYNQKGRGGW
jgi:hypothetical protein